MKKNKTIKNLILELLNQHPDKFFTKDEIKNHFIRHHPKSNLNTMSSTLSLLKKLNLLDTLEVIDTRILRFRYKINDNGLKCLNEINGCLPFDIYSNKPNDIVLIKNILSHLRTTTDKWITSKEIGKHLGLPGYSSAKIGQKLHELNREGIIKRIMCQGGLYNYKIDDNFNFGLFTITPQITNTVARIDDRFMLEARIKFLLDNEIEKNAIEKTCYNALEPLIDKVNDKKRKLYELDYLNRHNFSILEEFESMKNEIESLKNEIESLKNNSRLNPEETL